MRLEILTGEGGQVWFPYFSRTVRGHCPGFSFGVSQHFGWENETETISLDSTSERTNSSVCRIASDVRYCITPSHEQNVLRSKSKLATRDAPSNDCLSKSIGTNVRFGGAAIPAPANRVRFQLCVAG